MMLDQLAKNLVMLKQEFTKTYDGHSHIQEFIPISTSASFPINDTHLKSLHNFAAKNPIYHNSYEEKIKDIRCTVYEGDINEYWLNSIKHGSSLSAFLPYLDSFSVYCSINCKKFWLQRTSRHWFGGWQNCILCKNFGYASN